MSRFESTSALLGLIEAGSGYGYDLKQSYDRWFGSKRPIAFGQVYATLARFVRNGWLALAAEEAGAGPDRKRYEITETGRSAVAEWLMTPDIPQASMQDNLLARTMVSLLLGRDPLPMLEAQRATHAARMRELTAEKRTGDAAGVLACDLALFHVEADMRWMDLVASRLSQLREVVA